MERVEEYLMEHDGEAFRLDMKTDVQAVERQARRAGIRRGMRVADIGCGPGKTTAILKKLVGPDGTVVGVDASADRIRYAEAHHAKAGINFVCCNVLESLEKLGKVDFLWVRFFLEYFRSGAFEIVQNLDSILKPGGTMCLIDLDYNCMNHYGIPEKLDKAIQAVLNKLHNEANFDPYAGRKLYSYLYDLNYSDIQVEVSSHNLITGMLSKRDQMNWEKKVQVASQRSGYKFTEYTGGYEEFEEDFNRFFQNPRRFTYTPLILCRGLKPENAV